MTDPVRIEFEDARRLIESGKAPLVCAYDDPGKWKKVQLAEAISYDDFRQRLPNLPKSQEIIFYCA